MSYTVPESETVFGVVTDAGYPDCEYSCYVYSLAKGFDANWDPVLGTERQWLAAGDYLGNVCVRAVIEGDNLPRNKMTTYDYYVPNAFKPNTKQPVEFMFQNLGANAIGSLTLSMAMGDAAPQEIEAKVVIGYDDNDENIYGSAAYRQYGIAMGEFSYDKEAPDVAWKLSVSAINGVKLDAPIAVAEGSFLSIENGFDKRNVFEEGTGTWCGYCVVGIAGMEYMRENYADEGFIGIAAHESDRMDVFGDGKVYSPLASYFESAPICFANRNMSQSIYPDPEELEDMFSQMSGIPAVGSLAGTIENTDQRGRNVRLTLESEFVFAGTDSPYSYAYVVTEDHVGPYVQKNYLAGEPDEDSYGYGSMPEEFSMYYDDVARNCSEPFGVEGSLPAEIKVGEKYSAKIEFALNDVKDLNKYHVVGMIINNRTGAIENAVLLDSPTYVGIDAIDTDNSAYGVATASGKLMLSGVGSTVRVYRIDGTCAGVADSNASLRLAPGMYIVTDGATSRKVIVK